MKKYLYRILIICIGLIFLPNPVNAALNVAAIGETEYESLKQAIENVNEGETIHLLQDVDLTDYDDILLANLPDNVTFDLKNKSITLQFLDSYHIGNLIFTGNNLTIKNGTFKGRLSYSLWIGDEADTNGVVVENVTTDGGINVYHASNVVLRNVNAVGHDYYAVWGDNDGEVIIESGNYSTNGKNGLIGSSDKPINIHGGNFVVNDNKLLPGGNYPAPVISGGTFNLDVSEYIKEGYQGTSNNGVFQVNKIVKEPVIEMEEFDLADKVAEITFGVLDSSKIKEVLLETLSNTDEVDITDKNVKVTFDIQNVELSETIKKEVQKISNHAEDINIVKYFSVNANVIDDDTNQMIGKLTKLNRKISFVVALPEDLSPILEGYQRTYYIVSEDNHNYHIIEPKLNENGLTLTFEVDTLSNYVLTYYDEEIPTEKEEEINNPKTYDGEPIYLILGSISFLGLILSLIYRNKSQLFR